ncbi:helix-turn-helix transcriptional regulator [Actinacidiphila reveromycinica]|nr:LuxR family transcriptional regulator [Streptomyces sp. SN-593]
MDPQEDSCVTRSGPLYGRDHERAEIAGLVAEARTGRGGAVSVVADPGSGRSALLDAVAADAPDFGVRRIGGAAPEAGVQGAGLHRLLVPLAGEVAALPAARRGVLEEVLAGAVPAAGELPLGAALLGLLASLARRRPQLWCVDDAHWLDATSVRALGFVARRLAEVPAALVFAADPQSRAGVALDGLPVLGLRPLTAEEAGRLVADLGCGPPGGGTADEIVDLAAGSPLALVELGRAAGARQPAAPCLPAPEGRLRTRCRRRLAGLSPAARTVVALALAGAPLPTGVLMAAAGGAGLARETLAAALDEAHTARLVATGSGHVSVPGRLLRTMLSAELPWAEQVSAHRALAALTGPGASRPRQALHRLAAAGGTWPEPVAELEAAAGAVRATGDPAEAAAILEQGADFTVQGPVRARWLVTAAADRLAAGDLRPVRGLLARAPSHGGSASTQGLRRLVQGEIELRDGVPALAGRHLVRAVDHFAAGRGETLARALMLAGEATCLAGDFNGYFALADRARRLRRDDDPPTLRLVFEHFAGMSATFRAHHEEANRALGRVVRLAGASGGPEPAIWASQAAYTLGDARRAYELAVSAAHGAGELGAHALVPAALVYQALSALMLDRHAAAEAAALEGLGLARSTGQRNLAVDHLSLLALLAALQGDRAAVSLRLEAAAHEVAARELGRPGAFNCWASACLDLVEDRPADALARFRHMAAGAGQTNLAIRGMAAPHFVEAAVRCGRRDEAASALRGFESWAASSAAPGRLALAHRCHGLLAESETSAEEHFREALRLHRDDDAALEMAKTELFYAHRLRRARRPRAARGLLRDALAIFQQYEAPPWAARAAAELRAAGDRAGPAVQPVERQLTAQQIRISGLVARGATNQEIAELLVLSSRTVEYHLRNVYSRLGVRSRTELAALFAEPVPRAGPATRGSGRAVSG